MELVVNAVADELGTQEIKGRIRQFVAQTLLFNEQDYPFENADSFLQKGVIDSLGVVELVTFVSQEFGVQVNPSEVTPENFDSVDQLAGYIHRKLAQERGGNCAGS